MRPSAASLIALGLVVASHPGCRARGPRAAAELPIAVPSDVTGIFPNAPMTNDSFSLDINANVFEGLVKLDAQLVPVPALSDRWENPDPTTWLFHVRPDVFFSDGTPVTAADVVASFDAARRRGWCNEGALVPIASASAPDPATVKVKTRAGATNLLSRLHYGFVLPRSAVDAPTVPAIGTGPFRVASWSPGKELVLERNPRFRGPPAGVERIRFVVVPDGAERVARVVRGEAAMAAAPPLEGLARVEKDSGISVVETPGLRVVFLAFRVDAPPFSDPRVREAFDLAVDREEIVKRVLFGRAHVATQLVTPAVAGYDRNLAAPKADREKSRRLLAEAGFAHGLDVSLFGPQKAYTEDSAILAEVARQLSLVGVRAETHAMPKSEWVPFVESKKATFFLFGWSCETRDAGDVLDALIHSPDAGGRGRNNYQGIGDAELDALIEKAGAATEAWERNALFSRALARVSTLHLVVPLEIQPETLVTRKGLSFEPPLNFGLRLLENARFAASS